MPALPSCAALLAAATVALAPAPAALAQATGTNAPPAAKPATPPTPAVDPASPQGRAHAILDAAIEALGGQKAFDAIESVRTEIVVKGGPNEVRLTGYARGDDKVVVEQPVPQLGMVITLGRNGDVAWADVPIQGIQAVEVEQVEQVGAMVNAYRLLQRFKKQYGTIELVGTTEFEGRPCHQIRLADPTQPRANRPEGDSFLFVAIDDSRPVGMRSPAPNGRGLQVSRLKDWKKVGDVLVFHRFEVTAGGATQTFVFERIEPNVVDEARFEIPEAVRPKPAAPAEGGNAGAGAGGTGG